MSRNDSAFLNHLAESRREVEQWPAWKQDSLKASSQRDSAHSTDSEKRSQSERVCRPR